MTIKEKKILLLKTLEANGGNISKAAEAANISRGTFYNYMQKDKKFRAKVEEIKEGLVDFAESKLLVKITEGDLTAIMFFLKNSPVAKMRGWGEKHEVKHEGKMEIEVIDPFE